jgi:hypothetical protein
MATIDDIISEQQATVEDTLRTAREVTSRIGNSVVPALRDPTLAYTVNQPVLAPPPQFSDLFPGTDTSNEQIQWLDSEVDKLIEKYFPELTACLRDKPEEWLCKIISGSDPFGDSQAVIDAMWHEARDRAYRASNSEVMTLHADYSQRGFTIPPGALIQQRVEAEQRASQAIADVNRAQTIRVLELKVELLKFAEEQAIRLKLGLMDAIRAFYVVWASLPDKDIERARIRSQALGNFYGALSSYYNVQLGFEGLRLRAAEGGADVSLGVDRNRIAAFSQNQAAPALAQAVRGFTDVASSASNAISSLVAEITAG